ncbi:MAG: Z1 domain-containing protein [Ignavibacteria bacterium]|nr:Z1 domain-containing protein [Ignavibacteria bacterium]
MEHFTKYLETVTDIGENFTLSLRQSADAVWGLIEENFDYKGHKNGLILGNVQSGKTAQMLGVVSRLADEGFKLFCILTSDNVYLQQQTLFRVRSGLKSFGVYGEEDELLFYQEKLNEPIVIVLKKNNNVLKKWKNNLALSGFCDGRSIIIIDDEADAASLNTKVNKQEISTINGRLNDLKNLSNNSIYIQVTATPQALLLQTIRSGWKPNFVYYFPPGLNYIGGDFIYANPKPFCIRNTAENELMSIKQKDSILPEGLKQSLLSYLCVCAEFKLKGKDTCNFLVHPSVRINDHESFATKLGQQLNEFLVGLEKEDATAFLKELEPEWEDLRKTKPDIKHIEDIFENIIELINGDYPIKVRVLNSKSPVQVNFHKGFNIIIGGNSLSRGVTIPALQTVYYCRKSKTPQADTFWQHSRMFGYDRIPGLLRVFLPNSLYKLFSDLNASNRILIEQITKYGLEGVQLIYSQNVKPTRANVIDKRFLNVIAGGVNYFPLEPLEENTKELDKLLQTYGTNRPPKKVEGDFLIECLKFVGSQRDEDWSAKKFVSSIKALTKKRPTSKFYVIVRTDRKVAKYTGTLLSQNDRILGDNLRNDTVLTLYRLTGEKKLGWKGKPFWVPNIKLPESTFFYDNFKDI